MLKHQAFSADRKRDWQPPSGGCVLKLPFFYGDKFVGMQPPSGGCVLKLYREKMPQIHLEAAAFGRLCVETAKKKSKKKMMVCSRLRAAVC